MTARIRRFGETAAGAAVEAAELRAGELSARILTLGATLQDLRLAGAPWPLVLGADRVAAYETTLPWCGAIVGPVANRIGGAAARIGGRTFRFEANEGGRTTLHGGSTGTHAQIWRIEAAEADRLALALDLPDGLGGFPGNRRLRAEFSILPPATLTLRLTARTDAPTPVNLANHSYWNLDGSADTAGHRLRVMADRYLPVDGLLLPAGPPAPVAGTCFDLRDGSALDLVPRYDHNFCLADAPGPLREAAELTGRSGVRLRLETTEPGLQVYDGAGLASAPHIGLTGQPCGPFAGIALEAQRWPDALNRPDFPPVLLLPGATSVQETRFTLGRVA